MNVFAQTVHDAPEEGSHNISRIDAINQALENTGVELR